MGIFRNRKAFGERIEYWIAGEMLKEGLDVYLPTVDDIGIDIVVRREDKTFIEVQVKACSKDAKQGSVFTSKAFPVRRNYFFILYDEGTKTKWIFSSKELDAKAYTNNKEGKNKGRRKICLSNTFEKYIATNFDRLK